MKQGTLGMQGIFASGMRLESQRQPCRPAARFVGSPILIDQQGIGNW
jgi:hypothetical protein